MGTVVPFHHDDEWTYYDKLVVLFESSESLKEIDDNFEMVKRMILREKIDEKQAKQLKRILKKKRAIISQAH